jgi:hypothetical protein
MIPRSPTGEDEGLSDERIAQVAIDFITYCYERRGAGWPSLYDEMCSVAGNRLYRGLGYEELREAGLDLTLGGLGKTSKVVNEVTRRMRAGVLAPAT